MSRLLKLAAAAMLAAAIGAPAAAQDYPNRPVKIIVPFGAGGPADVYARFVGQHLQEALKQSFVIENRPGAGSIIGTDEVAKSAPDGYTLLMMSNTHTINETLIPNKPFQLMRDFVPVAPVNYSDLVMVVHPSVPAKDLKEFIALAEVEAGRAQLRLVGARHALSHGRRAVQSHERHRHRARAAQGSGEARNSVIGGHVQMMFDAITTMAPNVQGGQVRALGTTGKTRSEPCCRTCRPSPRPACPATRRPSGSASWRRPARRKPIVDKLNAEINKVLARPDVQGGLGQAGRRADAS